MQADCANTLKTARDLLNHGVLSEGAEELVKLRACGRQAGCFHWHCCMRLVESEWRATAATGRKHVAAG